MTTKNRTVKYLKEYIPPDFLVDRIDLTFHLAEGETRVLAREELRRNPLGNPQAPLFLHGRELELSALSLDGLPLARDRFAQNDRGLTLPTVPDRFTLEIETRIHPERNTALEGLYAINGLYCTQCEAQGFRKITFFPDRPDVLARFTTTLIGDRTRLPTLLANGNRTAQGELDDGRHFATWEDPFPKPSYLFALVAGDLACHRGRFRTFSGREVTLEIHVEHDNADKCEHALLSLQKAMAWDETRFGREYDLDLYMIVAVNDFNMGAMENKGLNLFNAKYVLARPETATDQDFEAIESIIAHEYFHNWTGNRVTCRDWFQLSLKEGLTVFRDQEFSSDLHSRAVQRITDVRQLRTHQFAEDAGPTAHPVQPDSYMEINNFYTTTVYDKGAEVVRMLDTLLGTEGFRRGLDLYFARHDGQAVTVEEFVAAMEAANGCDLGQFRLWYRQAGTPELQWESHWEADSGILLLEVSQSCPPTPGQPVKEPLHIPFALGLLATDGRELPVLLEGDDNGGKTTRVLSLKQARNRFRLVGLKEPPRLSPLRGFSAPVKLTSPRRREDLAFLWRHDRDLFNRWDAGQTLMESEIFRLMDGDPAASTVDEEFLWTFAETLNDTTVDKAWQAISLALPSTVYLQGRMLPTDPERIHAARQTLRKTLAVRLRESFLAIHAREGSASPYRFTAPEVARRALRNLCLEYLSTRDEAETTDPETIELAMTQFRGADNMTDRIAALVCLVGQGGAPGGEALDEFHHQWRHDTLVMDKWFAVQAAHPSLTTLEQVRKLMHHPLFQLTNPNKVRALIGTFSSGNPRAFHLASGEGYRFVADRILELDPLNPQMAARLLQPLRSWRQFEPRRQALMRLELERILAAPGLSRDTHEIAMKSLGDS
ncbi:MAG: aminopeptidase N [Magnetococcales bacterium]|nr:aminopeptidase N [Magnetococcales bacterium]MBF0157083.1 aminopeptidase N [Magnetococcales bacterium]